MESIDVVVIGGGLGGLATAAYVARAGLSVRVLEKAKAPGGRAATQLEAGFAMNLGPHALYRGGPAKRVLNELEVEHAGKCPSASGAFALYQDEVHALPTGFISLLTTGLMPIAAKLEAARWLARIASLDPAPLERTTVEAWLADVRAPEVRHMLEAFVRVSSYANAPGIQSAGAAVAQLQRVQKHNVEYLDGGWQTLVEGLRAAAERAGARIEGGAKASAVRAEPGAPFRVALDGREIAAKRVVIAASPAVARGLVPSDAALQRFAEQAVPIEAACLDVALIDLPRPANRFILGIDRPYYASVHSATAAVAPEGKALIHVAKYLPPGGEGTQEELEHVLELLQPGFRDRVVARRFFPKLRVAHAVVAAERGGLSGRPAHDGADTEGLFLVGDWVGDEGMLADAALGSARRAAEAVVAGIRGGAPRAAASAAA
jgi:phytoene dehydrogenase-like protein